MSQIIDLEVNDAALNAWFGRYLERVTNAEPVMRKIAATLAAHTDEAFAAQGIPPWVDLADSTAKRREADGTWPGMILHVTGTLASSYTTSAGPDYAMLSSFLPYAAIQNFGGKAGRNHAATLPARRQIPVDDHQQLIPEAREDILAFLAAYFGTNP
ncbi:phage virion morphogenesis protein [Ralstonia mannitolilytica]|uniref:phage virion morphogenesis protein n=1 Tax=Ralstonia mannitolilytica TaxID=105219 RepID=UPI000CEF54F8|nr:phage virion morphogenesis protein [Ralstonia mannitolilytica]